LNHIPLKSAGWMGCALAIVVGSQGGTGWTWSPRHLLSFIKCIQTQPAYLI